MSENLIDKNLETAIATRGRQIRRQALQRYYIFVLCLGLAIGLGTFFPLVSTLFVLMFLGCAAAAALPAIRANQAFGKQQYRLASLYADQAMMLNLQLYPLSTWSIGHLVDLQMRYHAQQGNNAQVEAIGKLIWSLTERKETTYDVAPRSAWAANYVALAYLGQERYDEAIELFQKILTKVKRADHSGVLTNNLGYAYFRCKRYDEAEQMLRGGLLLYKKPWSAMEKRIAAHLKSNLGRTLLQLGKLEEAEKMLDECLAERERDRALPNEMGEIHRGIAELRLKQNRLDEAELYFHNAIGLYRQFFAPHHPVIAETLLALADVVEMQGRTAEAEKLRMEAQFIRHEHDENEQVSLTKVIAAFSSNEPLITTLAK